MLVCRMMLSTVTLSSVLASSRSTKAATPACLATLRPPRRRVRDPDRSVELREHHLSHSLSKVGIVQVEFQKARDRLDLWRGCEGQLRGHPTCRRRHLTQAHSHILKANTDRLPEPRPLADEMSISCNVQGIGSIRLNGEMVAGRTAKVKWEAWNGC